jgi:hypothetical protein
VLQQNVVGVGDVTHLVVAHVWRVWARVVEKLWKIQSRR